MHVRLARLVFVFFFTRNSPSCSSHCILLLFGSLAAKHIFCQFTSQQCHPPNIISYCTSYEYQAMVLCLGGAEHLGKGLFYFIILATINYVYLCIIPLKPHVNSSLLHVRTEVERRRSWVQKFIFPVLGIFFNET